MSKFKKAILLLCCGTIVLSFSACKKEGPAERAGRNIDESAGKAGQKIDDAARKAGDKIEDAGKKIKESVK
jgi:hypothetical protein